jgi:hypothetical protein
MAHLVTGAHGCIGAWGLKTLPGLDCRELA